MTVAFENTYKEESSTAQSKNRRDKNPNTGDHTPIAACTMLMLAAAGMTPLVASY